MQECKSQKHSLEEEMATRSRILAWGNHTDRRACRATVHGVAKQSDMTERAGTRDSLSNGSEGLFQREKEAGRMYRSFHTHTHTDTKQAIETSKDCCYLKKTRHLKFRNLVLFSIREDAEDWSH